ncbi:MAG: tetratricopeptide repeat protein [Sphingobacteriaceae bacterium]|nr:tetratricopeptide repeat protein [Sphingobacteriaceae bacterium]
MLNAQVDQKRQARADSIENLLPNLKDTSLIIANIKLTNFYLEFKPVKALGFAKNNIAVMRKSKNKNWVIKGWNNYLQTEYYFGSVDTVLSYQEECFKLALDQKDTASYCNFMITFASANDKQNKSTEAVKLNIQAATLATKHNIPKICSRAYHNIGTNYLHKSEYDVAIDYFLKAREYKLKEKEEQALASTLMSIGICYAELGSLDSTKKYFLEAEKIALKFNNNKTLASISENLANVYMLEKNYDKARVFYLKSLKAKEALGDKHELMLTHSNLAGFFLTLNDPTQALHHLEISSNLNSEFNDLLIEQINFEHFASAYSQKKDYEKAYLFSKKQIDVINKLNKKESAKQIAEMNSKYESDKKQLQIDQLNIETNFKNEEIKHQRNISTLISFLGILILVFAIVLFVGFRNKRKANALLSRLNSELEHKKTEIEHQNQELSQKNKEILDSIYYAQRIQNALLPSFQFIGKTINRLIKND